MPSPGSGAIALSEFSTTAGICQGDSICDFESGNCGWTVSSTNPNYQFKLTQADSVIWRDSRDVYDHTTEADEGHFMEAHGGIKFIKQ